MQVYADTSRTPGADAGGGLEKFWHLEFMGPNKGKGI